MSQNQMPSSKVAGLTLAAILAGGGIYAQIKDSIVWSNVLFSGAAISFTTGFYLYSAQKLYASNEKLKSDINRLDKQIETQAEHVKELSKDSISVQLNKVQALKNNVLQAQDGVKQAQARVVNAESDLNSHLTRLQNIAADITGTVASDGDRIIDEEFDNDNRNTIKIENRKTVKIEKEAELENA